MPFKTLTILLLACVMSAGTAQANLAEAEPAAKRLHPLDARYQDLWQRVRDGMHWDIPVTQEMVSIHLRWFKKRPEFLQRVFKRGEPYFYHIVAAVEERNMPLELALLPVVESAFDPFAYSPGQAAGLWQFIPATGKRFGLDQNWWYDGRRDPLEATRAALEYLSFLHRSFDEDWLLAVAAYNTGEGNLRRAIRRAERKGLSGDFWSLRLPNETEHYVPRLLALSAVVRNPSEYGLSLPQIANRPTTAVVEIDGQLDLMQAARLAEVPVRDIYTLNPAFNRWASPPDGPHRLLLPIAQSQQFQQAYLALPVDERIAWHRHQVKAGDTLSEIAEQYHTTVDSIRSANQLRGNLIRQGQNLLVPTAGSKPADYVLSEQQRRRASRGRGAGEPMTHVVARGDTLWDLSRDYKTTPGQLARWNNMSPRDTLRPGRKLLIWTEEQQPETHSERRRLTYTVRSGDSLWRIADRFDVSVTQLTRWNAVSSKQLLKPGQQLKLYVQVAR